MNENQRQYVKLLTSMLYDVQKLRVALGNRIDALDREGDTRNKNMAEELREEVFPMMLDMEMVMEKRIGRAVQAAEVMRWLKAVRGIGPRYSGTLIGMVGSPPETVSQLWSLCGMDTIPICMNEDCIRTVKGKPLPRIAYTGEDRAYFLNRQAERRYEQHLRKESPEDINEEEFKRKAYLDSDKHLCQCEQPDIKIVAPQRRYFRGLLLNHNPFLKMTCWKIAGQFVRQGKFYRTVYEQYKDLYIARDGDILTAGHIENRARRATVKLFLSHLWEMWRKSLGMDAGTIYLQHKLGDDFDKYHTYIDPPYAGIFD